MHSLENTKEFQEDDALIHPSMWDRLLEGLPEGAELVLDETGRVVGVTLQIEISLDSFPLPAEEGKDCKNSISDRGNEIFQRLSRDWVRLTEETGREPEHESWPQTTGGAQPPR